MSVKKTVCAVVVATLVALPLAACSGTPSSSGDGAGSDPVQAQKAKSDYEVTIDGCTSAVDYQGNPAAVIDYSFTNNSDEAQSLMAVESTEVYQNGIQCEPGIVDGVDTADWSNKVKPGGTIKVRIPYALQDTSDIEVEVKEYVSASDEPLATQTFSLS